MASFCLIIPCKFMQPKKHNNNPQSKDTMPPHGHGVKDNEENQSCSNASLDHLRLDHTSSGCGIGSRLWGTLQYTANV